MDDSYSAWSGKRVRLRAIAPGDADSLHRYGFDTKAMQLGDEIRLPVSLETFGERLASRTPPKGDNTWLAVEAPPERILVGSVNTHDTDQRHGNFSYGVAIFREHWRRGYATEAVKLLLRYYFCELGYYRVTAKVYEFNAASIAFHRHMGFKEEGRIRQSLFTSGKRFDELLFGMLGSEFMEKAGESGFSCVS